MSSILRALKKLENEPRHLEESQPLENKFFSSADTAPERTFSSIFIMVLGGGIVCGLVILAGWWLFSEKFQPPPAVTQTVSQPHARLDKNQAPSKTSDRTQESSAISEIQAKTSTDAGVIQEPMKQISEEPKPGSFEESAFRIIDLEDDSSAEEQTHGEVLPGQETPSLTTRGQATRTAAKPVAASVTPPATPVKTGAIEIPKLNDPDMKLQAITWSRTPQKRITVINSRILREGEMVSGYIIHTINQDDVVLSQEGKKWKLLFHN